MAGKEDFKFYVIGTGLPRTGTLSLKVALEKILPGNCMHFTTFLYESDLKEVFHDLLEQQTSTDESFKNYFIRHNIVAGVDVPFICHYKRVMKLFPEAKVVLTVREPSTWIRSMEQVICPFWLNHELDRLPMSFLTYFNPSKKRLFKYIGAHPILHDAVQSVSNGKGEEYFNNWVEDVKKTVPSERLLIFSVKEGWEPLCKFLDLPIPDEPFPHVNDALSLEREKNIFKAKMWIMMIGMSTIPILLGYGALKLFNYTRNNIL